jgi:hypothetical protein
MCKAVIPWEERGERRLDLGLMVRLYNHQVSTIGINQILTTFMPERSPEIAYFNHGVVHATGDVVGERIGGSGMTSTGKNFCMLRL